MHILYRRAVTLDCCAEDAHTVQKSCNTGRTVVPNVHILYRKAVTLVCGVEGANTLENSNNDLRC